MEQVYFDHPRFEKEEKSMSDKELLLAISGMLDKKLQPIEQGIKRLEEPGAESGRKNPEAQRDAGMQYGAAAAEY